MARFIVCGEDDALHRVKDGKFHRVEKTWSVSSCAGKRMLFIVWGRREAFHRVEDRFA